MINDLKQLILFALLRSSLPAAGRLESSNENLKSN
jgi:hypothetical protein